MKHETLTSSSDAPPEETDWNKLVWNLAQELFPSPSPTKSETSPTEAEKAPSERFRVDPANYPIFSRQAELDERWGNDKYYTWNIDKTLSHFVTKTANLIATIDGTSTEYDDNPERTPPDHVIYLDKSARPVSWLVNTFWSDFSDRERPSHSYLNVDRLNWFRAAGTPVDYNGYLTDNSGLHRRATPSDFDIDRLPPDTFARIRSLFLPDGIDTEDPNAIMNTPSTLDGKNLLIVDEVSNSGSTVAIAKKLLEKAIPEAASINTASFWPTSFKFSPDGQDSQMLTSPVWYNKNNSHGRGIGDIDPKYYSELYEKYPNPKTLAKKYGSIATSRPIDLATEPHQMSRELMHEIQLMHQDFQDGHILLRPPSNYDDDRQEVVVEAQGLRLLPSSDPTPDSLSTVMHDIDARPPVDGIQPSKT